MRVQNSNQLLPLDAKAAIKIAVSGDEEWIAGGGSGNVKAAYTISAWQGIANASSAARVTHTGLVRGEGEGGRVRRGVGGFGGSFHVQLRDEL